MSTHRVADAARRTRTRSQFRLILAATYPFFLVAAVAAAPRAGRRRAPRRTARAAPSSARPSAMAVQAIPFAFMG